MAVDEVLLDQAAGQGIATLRFYQWSKPTLSLGYFQPYAERDSHTASAMCPVVRRHSGGGAILHDRELTYSLALPPGSHPARDPHALYLSVHRSLRDQLVGWTDGSAETHMELCSEAIPPSGGDEPFLCFQRRALGDLVATTDVEGLPQTVDGRHKVTGSSQRKRRGAVLQHGSILLRRSDRAPQLPGLQELAGKAPWPEELARSWAGPLAETLGLAITEVVLSEEQLRLASGLRDARFAQSEWIGRR